MTLKTPVKIGVKALNFYWLASLLAC